MRRFTVHLVVTILFSLHSFAQTSDESAWGSMSPGITYVITPGGFKEPPGPGEGAGITVSAFTFEIRSGPLTRVTVRLSLPTGFTSAESIDSLPLTRWGLTHFPQRMAGAFIVERLDLFRVTASWCTSTAVECKF